MWPLLGFSLVSTVLILERGLFWAQILQRQQPLVQEVLAIYPNNPQQALTLLQQSTSLPIARIFLAALTLPQSTPEEFRLALESAAQAELPVLKRFNTVFETIIGVAPLLGLLGTVLGLIRVLYSLRLGDIAGENAMGVTGGIGEALISTAAGLVVAIFTLVCANFYQGLYRRQRAFIQGVGGQLELAYRRSVRMYLAQRTPPKVDASGDLHL